MTVQLKLVGGVVSFSPPLTPHSSLPSIPEIVARWMDSYVATTCQLPRVLPNTQVSWRLMHLCASKTHSLTTCTYTCNKQWKSDPHLMNMQQEKVGCCTFCIMYEYNPLPLRNLNSTTGELPAAAEL